MTTLVLLYLLWHLTRWETRTDRRLEALEALAEETRGRR